MLIRDWQLNRLFEDEATDAGEGSSGAAAVVSDAPAVEAAPVVTENATGPLVSEDHSTFEAYFDSLDAGKPTENSTEDTPAETPTESVTAESGGDAVGRTTDDAGDKVVDAQRDALVSLAKAYDWSDEELKGFTGEQLQRLIAREEKRLAQPGGQRTEPAANVDAVPNAEVSQNPFEDYVSKRTAQLEADGFDEEHIALEIERERLQYETNNQLVQTIHQERAQRAWEQETTAFDNFLLTEIVPKGFADLLGKKPYRQCSETEKVNRGQVFSLYKALQNVRPGVPGEHLVMQAFNGVFGEQIQHRTQASQSRKLIEHSKRRMGSPSSTAPQKGVEWTGPTAQDPVLVEGMQRVQAERRQRVGSR